MSVDKLDKFDPLTAYELRIKALELAIKLYERRIVETDVSVVETDVIVKWATEFLDFFVEEFYTPILPEDEQG